MTWEQLEAAIVYLSLKNIELEKNLNAAKRSEDYWYQECKKLKERLEEVTACTTD